MKLKTVPDYVPLDPASKGGPKHGHYAELDPHFAAAKAGADAVMASLWAADDWHTFRNNWKAEAPLPDGTPRPGTDVVESYRRIPTRDGGAEIEIKIMKSVANKAADNVCVLRYHGGGWAIGGHGTEAVENLHAASHPNVVLVSVDYRLAPEHPYPTPFHDCFDALLWVKANAAALGIDPEKIVLLGGSAGSNLALAVALKARADNVTGIRAMLLDWPTACHPRLFQQLRDRDGYELESYVQCFDATVTTVPIMEFFLDAYLPTTAKLEPDPYHSPLLADSFEGLPPAFLQVAGFDPLRDEALAVAEKLQKDSVPVELHVYKGLPHAFSTLLASLPQAKEYQQRQNVYLDNVVKSS
ncbi:lipase esterase [Ophiostoma piceae UAMH 11346]|uniref:Lipase esterase n=1 Tax=Ophiostoma piceae (strain UAMH 11346) TaxID=1262450 RepID=S3C3T1_OPHP1|nr:lipase esterase [Ophiostoma piceae UAMH 11346]